MKNEDYLENRNGLFTGQQVPLKQAIIEIIWVFEIFLALLCLPIGLGIFIYSFFNPSLYTIFWGFFIGIGLFKFLLYLSIGWGFPLNFIDFEEEK